MVYMLYDNTTVVLKSHIAMCQWQVCQAGSTILSPPNHDPPPSRFYNLLILLIWVPFLSGFFIHRSGGCRLLGHRSGGWRLLGHRGGGCRLLGHRGGGCRLLVPKWRCYKRFFSWEKLSLYLHWHNYATWLEYRNKNLRRSDASAARTIAPPLSMQHSLAGQTLTWE